MNWHSLFIAANKMVILYFLLVNLSYLILLVLGARSIIGYFRRKPFAGFDFISRSEWTLPISILVPAYNEEKTIADSAKALLSINYPELELIIINDGSKDRTMEVLVGEFLLRKVDKAFKKALFTKPIKGAYISAAFPNLLVIDKENGGKADALNAGLNFSKYPLFCSVDADTILEENSLVRLVKPFLEHPELIASGGIIRVANGCQIEGGKVLSVRTTKNPLVNFQIIEYLRAFLTGRTGWSAMNSLLIISGAFGLFRKIPVIQAGGYRTDTVGEDVELVVRLHRYMLKKRKRYRILFIADPICWTEVPENFSMLLKQRKRWHRGLFETLAIFHRDLLSNHRYGRIGFLAMPYFFFFELLGPIFEIIGYLIFTTSLVLGHTTGVLIGLFFIVSVLFGMLLSMGALLIEEFDFHRYERWGDVFKLGLYALLENLGYRQLLSLWRALSLFAWSPKGKSWGYLARKGFAVKPGV